MQHPLTRRNPFHPVTRGYSLLFALELLAREEDLHRVPVVDSERKLINLITQVAMELFFYVAMSRWIFISCHARSSPGA